MLVLAAALRLPWLDAGWFGVDQARDLTWASRIASGEAYPVIGPAMRNRVHLGALYYYFWALPFFFSPEPLSAYVFAGLLGVLATALTFEVGRRVDGPPAGLAAALVFATTPLAVIDGRVAWAPAAIPALCASLLLVLVILLRSGSGGLALVAAALAALLVQLHLAAAPAVLVTAVVILSRSRRLGVGWVVAAGLTGLVVLAPTLWAVGAPTEGVPGGATPEDGVGRLASLLTVSGRAFSGLSPDPTTWPAWVRMWGWVESAWGAVVVLALVVFVTQRRAGRPVGPRLVVAGTWLGSWVAVWILPWEAWYYYLDLTLVPAAVVVGVVAIRALGARGWWLLVGLGAGRAALLLWWIHGAHAAGFVAVNPDLLRLGGSVGVDDSRRARIPTASSRVAAARTLAGSMGFAPPDLWQRVHGPGFGDLDTDNGYFFTRAGGALRSGDDAEAVVTYRGQVPAPWRSALPAPIVAGPFEILRYQPWLRRSRGLLLECGSDRLPARPSRSPLEYGAGEIRHPRWPCAHPLVEVPFARPPGDTAVVRVFARLDGAGQVVEIEAVPPGAARPVDTPPAGFGRGIEIRGAPTHVRVRLSLDGPASLDLFELRGR